MSATSPIMRSVRFTAPDGASIEAPRSGRDVKLTVPSGNTETGTRYLYIQTANLRSVHALLEEMILHLTKEGAL